MEVIVEVNEEYLEDFLKNLKHYDKNYVIGYRFEPNEILTRDIYNSLEDVKNQQYALKSKSEYLSVYVTETFLGIIEHLDEKFGFHITQTFDKFAKDIHSQEMIEDIDYLDIGITKGVITNMIDSEYMITFNYLKLSSDEICFFIALPMSGVNQETLNNLDFIINKMHFKHWGMK